MTLLELLRQTAANSSHPAGSAERIAELRAAIEQHRTDNPDEAVDLAALDTDAMAAFDERQQGTLDAAALADMQALADVCEATRDLAAADQQAADELAAEAAALAARVSGNTDPQPGEPDDGEPGDGGQGDPDPADPPADPAPADPAPEPALVAAGRRTPRVPLASLPNNARRNGGQGSTAGRTYTWQAAADIRGVNAGAELRSSGDLVEAIVSRMSAYNRVPTRGVQRAGIAAIRREGRGGMPTVDTNVTVQQLADLTDETRLPGGSLVAAGGWCAPSEINYDLLPGADANAGIVDLPTITTRRGGVRWPSTPQFSALYATSGIDFYQTEATVIAGETPKPCYEIPCTTFNEERLGVTGVCVRSPILTERGYPELVEAVTSEVMAVHAHKVNQRKIADMVADGTAVTMSASEVSFAGYSATILSAVELQVEYLRYRHRWSPAQTVEVVLPLWARGTVRADLAGRNGQPFETVTDAQINAWFADRGASVQWVYDWQDSFATGQAGDFGGTTPPKRFPATVSMMIYRAGTFFVAEQDVITVDGLYDSALLEANMHLALFTEEGYVVGKRNWPAILLTVPVFPGGYTGEQVDPPALNLIPDPA